ncbi:trans-Golgi network-localized SYP41-interacting protein 1-like isoform X1 [Typha angustifolia]|uniref:trans-Golgi network-localized SYP41-interacting protein 1-like isoform X1 n=1 Tax=Typha angustifolia TaxID=59011 RepID=UPI003C2FE36F
MPDNSDSDSSPKSSSSSSSSSGADGDRAVTVPGMSPTAGPDQDPTALPDPESPSNAQQSSDESGSSDGVLVELPGNSDQTQDSRRSRRDPDSGILVNIDGSMQEQPEDSTREESFEDATDQLGMVGGRSVRLDDSMAVIEIGESSGGGFVAGDLSQIQAECQKYKDEREVFRSEIVGLWQHLQDMVNHQSFIVSNSDELVEHLHQLESPVDEKVSSSSPMPLHSMLGDCSKFIFHLKGILDEKASSGGMIRELNAALYTKEQEIEDLNVKALEFSMSHDVVISYLRSLRETWAEPLKDKANVSEKLLASLESVVGPEEDTHVDGTSLVERKTLLLIEKHKQFLMEIEQLGQTLAQIKPDFEVSGDHGAIVALTVAREELLESKRKEAYLQEKIDGLEKKVKTMEENLDAANAATSKTRIELEQAESKLATTREKLSMAVTKGKSLLQSRDSLKQSLAEKTSELEGCMLELHKKSESLRATEASVEELKQLLTDKTREFEDCLVELQQKSDALETAKINAEDLNKTYNMVNSLQDSLSQRDMVLQEIEQVILESNFQQEVLSLEVADRIKWLVNQKNVADIIFTENHKIKDALSLVDLPEIILHSELSSQVNWLVNSLNNAIKDITKMQEEISGLHLTVASHESELSSTREEIYHLTASLLEEKQEKNVLQSGHADLRSKYEDIAGKFSVVSSEKNELIKVLVEVSEITLDNESLADTNSIIEKCMVKMKEGNNVSIAKSDQFERLQSLLYMRDQELMLCKEMLEDELIDRSERMRLSDELQKVSVEVTNLRNDKESLQKELLRVEEKFSLLREKLSMAVKKGKGLVQEREGFKLSLDEKKSEIEKLKHELQLKDSAIFDCKEQINHLSAFPEIHQKLEAENNSLKDQREQIERNLCERNSYLQALLESIEKIALPSENTFEGPIEKVNWIVKHIQEAEIAKIHLEEELVKVKEESILHANRLVDAFATIESLENKLSKAEEQISCIAEERKELELGKTSMEQELEKITGEALMNAGKLADALATLKSLENALSLSEKRNSILYAEKNEAEDKHEKQIITLNAKLSECMEELVGTRGSSEIQSAELNGHLENLKMLMMDESLLSLMTAEFRKMINNLRNIGLIMKDIHEQFAAKGLHIHHGLEDEEFFKLVSVPDFANFINDVKFHSNARMTNLDDISSFSEVVEGLHDQTKFIGQCFKIFSTHMDDHTADMLQASHVVRDEFIHILELEESMKLDVDKLEAHNMVVEAKMVSMQKEVVTLLSACMDATKEIQIEFHDLFDSEFASEEDIMKTSVESILKEDAAARLQEDGSEYVNAANSLLSAARSLKIQSRQLRDVKEVWKADLENLKSKLQHAELTAKTVSQDVERVSTLEKDLATLQEICTEMRIKIDNYQAREDMIRAKEEELLSLDCISSSKDRGRNDQVLSEAQLEILIEKVSEKKIPFSESDSLDQGFPFSSPFDKLLYIVDKATEVQHRVDKLTSEKEDLQLILASHVTEIEHLKKATELLGSNYRELELARADIFELTSGLERIIQGLGGNEAFGDQKPITMKALLSLLERLTIASSVESENSRSRIQDLKTKLQAREKAVDELTAKIKVLEDSFHAQLAHSETAKESTIFEASSSGMASEMSEIQDVGPIVKNSVSPASTVTHVRTMRKGSNDHLVLNIDSETERLIASQETDDKGHVFKSLNTSGLIPKQGKLIADRVDSIWVSGGRLLMNRPRARLGLIAYWLFLHLWLLGTIV